MSEENSNKMPATTKIDGTKLIKGSRRSRARLDTLNFDPVERLVLLYRRLQEEDVFWSNLRMASSVTMVDANGNKKKTIRYSGVAHMAVLALMEKTSSDLMPYGYAKIPTDQPNTGELISPLVIKLTGKHSGEDIVVNPEGTIG